MSAIMDSVDTINYNTLEMYQALIDIEYDIRIMEPLLKRLMDHLKSMRCSQYPRRPERWHNLIKDFCTVKAVMNKYAFGKFLQDAKHFHTDPVKQDIINGVIEHSYPINDYYFMMCAKVPVDIIMNYLIERDILKPDPRGMLGRMYFNWRLRD